jgi:hypothetical protein
MVAATSIGPSGHRAIGPSGHRAIGLDIKPFDILRRYFLANMARKIQPKWQENLRDEIQKNKNYASNR